MLAGWIYPRYPPCARSSFLFATQAILLLTYQREKFFFHNLHTDETGIIGSGVEFVVAILYQLHTGRIRRDRGSTPR